MNRQRGFGMLGLSAMILVIVGLCAAVSVRSMYSARGSIRGIHSLQLQAAAEGAAVLLATGDVTASSTITIGSCSVVIVPDGASSAADASTSTSQSNITATLRLQDRNIASRKFATSNAGPDGPISVEALPQ